MPMTLPRNWLLLGLVMLILAVYAGSVVPAAAEFFGCSDQHTARRTAHISYASYRAHRHGRVQARAASYTRELAAQSRPHIIIHPRRVYPGRYAKRHCRSWLAKEYRVSGPVVVPRMRCWWE